MGVELLCSASRKPPLDDGLADHLESGFMELKFQILNLLAILESAYGVR